MTSLYSELISAYNNNDYNKMEKYLKQGANPCTNDAELFNNVVIRNDYETLKLLLKYVDDISEYRDIINLACAFNSVDCIKILYNKINLNDFKETHALQIINKIISVY